MRVFTGERKKSDGDYRKWKRWMGALLGKERLKGTPAEAFGDIVFTLLQGKAADAVDRLDVEDWEVHGKRRSFSTSWTNAFQVRQRGTGSARSYRRALRPEGDAE